MSKYLDIHSHILPELDDGSSSADMSLQMLGVLSEQGVGRIVATPHFYAWRDEPERFLKNRAESMKKLQDAIDASEIHDLPSIMLGAEVAFYSAMSNSSAIPSLCIEGTRLLLVEMPFESWTSGMLSVLCNTKRKYSVTPVLAHVDRYFKYFKQDMLYDILDNDILIQCNADAFSAMSTRRRATELLDKGMIHFLGTDCHNLSSRSPNMDEATRFVEKKLGNGSFDAFMEDSNRLLDRYLKR